MANNLANIFWKLPVAAAMVSYGALHYYACTLRTGHLDLVQRGDM